MVRVLWQESDWVAVEKPSGLLVHRTSLARERDNLLARTRATLGRWVYPVHRLDRATSGIVLFAFSSEGAARMQALFQAGAVRKKYLAIARGFTEPQFVVEKALHETETAAPASARTEFRTLGRAELALPVGRYSTARYSLVEAKPVTGRYHQIRKHLKSIHHPILGDTVYGDGKQNRFGREHLGCQRLMLAAVELSFPHPESGLPVEIRCPVAEDFALVVQALQGFPL